MKLFFPCWYIFSLFSDDFEIWRITYDVKFDTCKDYLDSRKQWNRNDKFIKKHNSENHTFSLGHNMFSHLSFEKFRDDKNLGKNSSLEVSVEYIENTMKKINSLMKVENHKVYEEKKTFIDWVEKGAVTKVKNQGDCGSCWSFSTTGLLEGAYFIKNGNLLSFSEQELVSCDNTDNGCNGGSMDSAVKWVNENGGICLEEDYPYEATDDKCSKSCKLVEGTKNVKTKNIIPMEYALEKAVTSQPISVGIDAEGREFQFYKDGVFTGECGTNIDHGVLVVGFGELDDVSYWKVKNSWGSDWGMGGYILIEKNNKIRGGKCGIHLDATGAEFI